jgi:hypothetical protein
LSIHQPPSNTKPNSNQREWGVHCVSHSALGMAEREEVEAEFRRRLQEAREHISESRHENAELLISLREADAKITEIKATSSKLLAGTSAPRREPPLAIPRLSLYDAPGHIAREAKTFSTVTTRRHVNAVSLLT